MVLFSAYPHNFTPIPTHLPLDFCSAYLPKVQLSPAFVLEKEMLALIHTTVGTTTSHKTRKERERKKRRGQRSLRSQLWLCSGIVRARKHCGWTKLSCVITKASYTGWITFSWLLTLFLFGTPTSLVHSSSNHLLFRVNFIVIWWIMLGRWRVCMLSRSSLADLLLLFAIGRRRCQKRVRRLKRWLHN